MDGSVLPQYLLLVQSRGVCLQPLSALLADCPVAGETARVLHGFFNEKPAHPLPCALCPGAVGGCNLLPPPPSSSA